MSDKVRLPELIDRFNNGELTDNDLNTFLEMLRTNPRVREEVRLDHELNEILANEDILELRQKILSVQKTRQKRKGPDFKLLLLAASLLLLFCTEVLLFIYNSQHSQLKNNFLIHKPGKESNHVFAGTQVEQQVIQSDTVKSVKTIPDQKTELKLAASFRKNPAFENMIGSTRHSAYFRMDAPEINYPFSVTEKLRFEWTLEGQSEIEFKIMDNTGTSVHESGLLTKNNFTLPAGTFRVGLYYYKVLQNDEILFFGKFFVK
jgi:hypothetical protein